MKKYIPIFAIMLGIFACKKKDSALPVKMQVVVNKDTVFVTTNVTTSVQTSFTYINGVSADGNQKLELCLSNYNGRVGTFYVDHHGFSGSTGYYRNGSSIEEAQTGRIIVTSVANGVITGTFDLDGNNNTFSGSFIAPQK